MASRSATRVGRARLTASTTSAVNAEGLKGDGGGSWESNPPDEASRPVPTGFEDRDQHQHGKTRHRSILTYTLIRGAEFHQVRYTPRMLPALLIAPLALGQALERGAVPHEPGLHELSYTVNGTAVRFTLVLPQHYHKKKGPNYPVLLALHYAGHGAKHYATSYVQNLVQPGFDGLGAIIVAPDCPGASWTDPAVDPLVLGLLDHVVATWRGRANEVAVTGFSMGGIGTWHMASTHPDRFRAAVPVAGHPRDYAGTITVPVFAVHGRRDELIAPAPTEAAIITLRGRGIRARYEGLEGLTHYEVPRYAPALTQVIPWIREQFETPR